MNSLDRESRDIPISTAERIRRSDSLLAPVDQNVLPKAWGWCTGMTQMDGMGREDGGGFTMGNTCIPVGDSF